MTRDSILERLHGGGPLLRQLELRQLAQEVEGTRIELAWGSLSFTFLAGVATRSTPLQIELAARNAQAWARGGHPLVVAPFLSESAMDRLEAMQVSGIDLCGNGLVVVPGQLLVRSTGRPNRHPESAPVRSLYAGQAGVVARVLLGRSAWSSLSELCAAAQTVSLAQASKTVAGLVEAGQVAKDGRHLRMIDRMGILDGLADAWRRRRPQVRPYACKGLVDRLSALNGRRWVVGGASTATHLGLLADAGPLTLLVDDATEVARRLQAQPEAIPAFAAVCLVEAPDPGCYVGADVDDQGMRWAHPLQVWLELQAGDARQRAAAHEAMVRMEKAWTS